MKLEQGNALVYTWVNLYQGLYLIHKYIQLYGKRNRGGDCEFEGISIRVDPFGV